MSPSGYEEGRHRTGPPKEDIVTVPTLPPTPPSGGAPSSYEGSPFTGTYSYGAPSYGPQSGGYAPAQPGKPKSRAGLITGVIAGAAAVMAEKAESSSAAPHRRSVAEVIQEAVPGL